MGRSSLLVGNLKKKYAQGFLPEKLPQQDHTTTTDSEMEEPYLQGKHRTWNTEGVCSHIGSRQVWKSRPSTLPFLVSMEELGEGVCEHVSLLVISSSAFPAPRKQGQEKSLPSGNCFCPACPPANPRTLIRALLLCESLGSGRA